MSHLKTASDNGILHVYFTDGKILDALTIQNIQDELLAVVSKATEPNVLLDFRVVKFLSSAALGMLVRAQKKCKEFKVKLALCNLDPSIREVFTITGLDMAMRICKDAEEAELAFQK